MAKAKDVSEIIRRSLRLAATPDGRVANAACRPWHHRFFSRISSMRGRVL
jgi:hypothetical protein